MCYCHISSKHVPNIKYIRCWITKEPTFVSVDLTWSAGFICNIEIYIQWIYFSINLTYIFLHQNIHQLSNGTLLFICTPNTTKDHIFVINCKFKKLILFNILILKGLLYKHSNMIQCAVQSVRSTSHCYCLYVLISKFKHTNSTRPTNAVRAPASWFSLVASLKVDDAIGFCFVVTWMKSGRSISSSRIFWWMNFANCPINFTSIPMENISNFFKHSKIQPQFSCS